MRRTDEGAASRQLIDQIGQVDAQRKLVCGGVTARVGSAHCVHFDLPYAWATQASFNASATPPTPEDLAAAISWLDEQSPGAWLVGVRADLVGATVERSPLPLWVVQHLGVWVTRTAVSAPPPEGVEIREAVSTAEVLQTYGIELEPLVRGRIGVPGDTWLVALDAGRAVACARLRVLLDTAYVSAVTVQPLARGRGIGRAISATATGLGLSQVPLAWLHCDDSVSGLYAALGYRRLTTHVGLGPGRGAPSPHVGSGSVAVRPTALAPKMGV